MKNNKLNTYRIYKNSNKISLNKEFEIVKVGFSWPMFFISFIMTSIWPFIKKIHKLALVLIIFDITVLLGALYIPDEFVYMDYDLSSIRNIIVILISVISQVAFNTALGLIANELYENNLKKNGYQLMTTMEGSSIKSIRNELKGIETIQTMQ